MSISLKPSSIVYWFRFCLALLTGFISYFLRLQGSQGFSLMIGVYLVSFYIVKYGFKYGEVELKGKNKRVLIGIGTYIFMWAFSWILLYTLFPYSLR